MASRIKGITVEIGGDSIKMTDALRDVNNEVYNTQAYYATALAGKEGMSGLISLLNLTQEEYDALSASMNNCSGIAGEIASVMQDNLQR